MAAIAPGSKRFENTIRETTDWEDVLVKHKILAPDENLLKLKAAAEEAKQRTETNSPTARERLTHAKDDEEIAFLEDEPGLDDDDERFFEKFRRARLEELKQEALHSKYGFVETLSRDEFIPKVTNASLNGGPNSTPMYVIVELFKEGLESSLSTSVVISELGKKHPKVKFVRMVYDQCIQGWPESRVPTIIIYFGGEMREQLIGFKNCGQGNTDQLEYFLGKIGVLPKKEPSKTFKMAKKYDDHDTDDW